MTIRISIFENIVQTKGKLRIVKSGKIRIVKIVKVLPV